MKPVVRRLLAAAALLSLVAPASAQPVSGVNQAPENAAPAEVKLAEDVHETIAHVEVTVRLFNGARHTGNLVITHFRPAGPGPFPVVVFNHGRTGTNRHEPVRWRALPTARYWTRRGFAVIVPTRIGYGELGQTVDPEASGSCANADFRPALEAMSTQVERAVEFARTLPWIDSSRIILSGVSYGGFATVGATARRIQGVIGAINFVGGLGGSPQARPGDPCQGTRVASLAAEAGRKSVAPMLWLYAENDTYWGQEWPRRWHEAFTGSGGKAKFVTFPPKLEEGHRLMSQGFSLWRPVVDNYLTELGFKLPAAATNLGPSGFAEITETDKVPVLKASTRQEAYTKFLAADVPRAFAISKNGGWAWRSGFDAVEVALSRCEQNARTSCQLYAVDDRVVWKPQAK